MPLLAAAVSTETRPLRRIAVALQVVFHGPAPGLRGLAAAGLLCILLPMGAQAAAPNDGGDPFGSLQWPGLRKEYFGDAPLVFDERVRVLVPAYADDPMNVPVTVDAQALGDVQELRVIVDRNPIRKVLEYFPIRLRPSVSFRFKLEQSSPVRAAARTADGVWHVGGSLIDSTGGGCTVAGDSRKDGSWARTLGQVSGKLFEKPLGSAPVPAGVPAARLRIRVMHPMDTGLAAGIPAFYINRLSLQDADGREWARLLTYEPVSENPVFSFDFAGAPPGPMRLVGTDNNGNRINAPLP